MKLHDNITPKHTEVNSDDNSVLRNIVIPILILIAFLAIAVAILYAFLRQLSRKKKENATETNQQHK
jgi:flagellar basal body-associated protein FliL